MSEPLENAAGSRPEAGMQREGRAISDHETPMAWIALRSGHPVMDSLGEAIGKISEVVADEQKDIFSGISLNPGLFKDERFVPADLIEEMTHEAVRLSISADQAHRQLEPNER